MPSFCFCASFTLVTCIDRGKSTWVSGRPSLSMLQAYALQWGCCNFPGLRSVPSSKVIQLSYRSCLRVPSSASDVYMPVALSKKIHCIVDVRQ